MQGRKKVKKFSDHLHSKKKVKKQIENKSLSPKYCNLGSMMLIVPFLKVYLFISLQLGPISKRDTSQRAEWVPPQIQI